MARRKSTEDLNAFCTLKKRDLDRLRQGVVFERTFRCSLDDLQLRTVRDRFQLSQRCLRDARRMLKAQPPPYRFVVSRAYYAMYHAVRSVVFFDHGGDDHEAHLHLPGHLPKDFARRAFWENALKGARLDRNRADYEPYPKTESSFRAAAQDTSSLAHDLLQECKLYLRSKGMQAMTSAVLEAPEQLVRRRFEEAKIPIDRVEARRFPGETIVLVFAPESHLAEAVLLANELDELIDQGFVTVKKSEPSSDSRDRAGPSSFDDPRIRTLIELLSSRARTSEGSPSLNYVRDLADNLNSVIGPRHQLIFGRRGVGKTALLVEAKRLIENNDDLSTWTNLQTLRNFDAVGAFLEIANRLCDLPGLAYEAGNKLSKLSLRKSELIQQAVATLRGRTASLAEIRTIVTDLHYMLHVLSNERGCAIYLFLDEMHYIGREHLPLLLDLIHAVTRDNQVWIKAAGIRHQCRWFSDDPPTGLQSGHDASIIDLDITLEEPEKARDFLWTIFRTYADVAQVTNISRFLNNRAVDRLVLASGGVPRDFLTLSAGALQVARQREKGRVAGVQDVNEAAGRAADIKLRELEEDAAASKGSAEEHVKALHEIRHRVVDGANYTFFRIDVRQKEVRPKEYELMQGIMDLRLVHLIAAGVSDAHESGRRYEVYMLDLSQFTGTRFKQRLMVLDFENGVLVQRKTRSKDKPFQADTARRRIQMFRGSPVFSLDLLGAIEAGVGVGGGQ